MFDPYLGRASQQRRAAQAWQVGFAALAATAIGVHPWLLTLALSPPEAVLPPATPEPAALRAKPPVAMWPPLTQGGCNIDGQRSGSGSGSRALYTPGPSVEALAKTPTAHGSRRSGRVRVRYCLGDSGTVTSAKVVRHFPKDPEIDDAVLRAVQRWRVDPNSIDGTDPCLSTEFAIEFE